VPPLIDDIDLPVRTERLLLRPAVVEDVESTWQMRAIAMSSGAAPIATTTAL
jgi:hypothetical protein